MIPRTRLALGLLLIAVTLSPRGHGQTATYAFSRYAGIVFGAGSNDGTNNSAQFNVPTGIGVDANGNLYVADTVNHTVRKISPGGVTTTFAGSAGALGAADGTGNSAQFNSPTGVWVDAAGNVYVADTGNNTVRKISPAGAVGTLAGSAGNSGSADGTGSAARFNSPGGLAGDSAGNIYVADTGNQTVRRITPTGVVSTLAGTVRVAGSADGSGSAAQFRTPYALAVDGAANVYVADAGNHTIRKITSAGVVSTLAGTAGSAGAVDGTGGAARFNAPHWIALDAGGTLVVADTGNNLIRKVSASGATTTFAGIAGTGRPIDGTGTAARFRVPEGVAVDPSGNIFVVDSSNQAVRKITPAAVVTTFAGSPGLIGSNDGTGAAALFDNPYSIAIDAAKNLYVSDFNNHTIRKITPAGIISTLAGSAGQSGTADGTGAAARFYYPNGLAVDAGGNVFVADTNNRSVRKITAAGVVTTVVSGSSSPFITPTGLALDPSGNFYVSDIANQVIYKVTAAGAVSIFAGASGLVGLVDGTGTGARFQFPYGLAADAGGNIYVADTGNNAIRKITAGGAVTTVAGAGGASGSADGPVATARFNRPFALAVDGSGNLFIADYGNNVIRRITAAGVVATIAGSGNFGATDGVGRDVTFFSTTGIALEAPATLYVVDSDNNVIRKGVPSDLALITSQPAGQVVTAGQRATFSVSAIGAGLTYQWLKNGAAISGATGPSFSIASVQNADAGSYIVRITSTGGVVDSAAATLAVASDVASIVTQPASQTVNAGDGVTFTVSAVGNGLSYQWLKNGSPVSGATGASFSLTAVQSADAGTYSVRVNGTGGGVDSAGATLTVNAVGPAGPAARLSNLSVRTTMAAGQTLIVGVFVDGGPRDVLVRAAGPSLTAFGLAGMADPRLDLFPSSSSTATFSNDDWPASLSTAFSSVGAFGFPAGSKDAAFVQTLTGGYSFQARGTGAGVVLVEAYDLGTGNSPRLTNVSARNRVGTGEDILIAGFNIAGTGSKQLLIRAVGPKLSAFGVTGALVDPKLEVYDSTGVKIIENDNWSATLASTFSSVGAFGLDVGSKDAALLTTLASGSYTVQVKGADGGTGEALVEIYEVP